MNSDDCPTLNCCITRKKDQEDDDDPITAQDLWGEEVVSAKEPLLGFAPVLPTCAGASRGAHRPNPLLSFASLGDAGSTPGAKVMRRRPDGRLWGPSDVDSDGLHTPPPVPPPAHPSAPQPADKAAGPRPRGAMDVIAALQGSVYQWDERRGVDDDCRLPEPQGGRSCDGSWWPWGAAPHAPSAASAAPAGANPKPAQKPLPNAQHTADASWLWPWSSSDHQGLGETAEEEEELLNGKDEVATPTNSRRCASASPASSPRETAGKRDERRAAIALLTPISVDSVLASPGLGGSQKSTAPPSTLNDDKRQERQKQEVILLTPVSVDTAVQSPAPCWSPGQRCLRDWSAVELRTPESMATEHIGATTLQRTPPSPGSEHCSFQPLSGELDAEDCMAKRPRPGLVARLFP
mmetsp:Transcript_52483/g.152786  ORF Transcript_52483/g.152786 Transcript_52483/m.152786 type:complete len:407 (+) Transcript_52483:127-1347(+)